MLKVHRWFILLGVVFIVFIAFSIDFQGNKLQSDFKRWLKDFTVELENSGISEQTIESFNKQVKVVTDLDKTLENKMNFQEELRYTLTDSLILKAQLFYKDNVGVLSDKEKLTTIPATLVVATMGVGSDFGDKYGNNKLIDILSTYIVMDKSAENNSKELLYFLQLVDKGYVSIDSLGNNDGTFTYLGILPSSYLFYAVDGDKDGNIDLYNNIQDILDSAFAIYVKQGWSLGFSWGEKVDVPLGVDVSSNQGLENAKPISFFKNMGITKEFGEPLLDDGSISTLMLTDGKNKGVLLSNNFNVVFKSSMDISRAVSTVLLHDELQKYKSLMTYKEENVRSEPKKQPRKNNYSNNKVKKIDDLPPPVEYRDLEMIK